MSLARSTADSRRAPRETVDCPTQIEGMRCPRTDALIVNVSPFGCMIRCDRIVPIGSILSVDLPSTGQQHGKVMWSLGARLGIEFHAEIPLDDNLAMLPLMAASPDDMLPN